MITVELSSFPKSGNTWLRHLVVKNFHLPDGIQSIPDFHRFKGDALQKAGSFKVSETGDKTYKMYKSHIVDNQAIYNGNDNGPDKILYIYRHPLDVLLSIINFKFIQGETKFFKKEIAKSFDDIVKDGEINFYFSRFLEDAGRSAYPEMLKDKASYFDHVFHATGLNKTISLRYEDLISDGKGILQSKLKELFETDILVEEGIFEAVDVKTKYSDNPFFWRATSGGYRKSLSLAQIRAFETKYSNELRELGYL